jgi:hypothetical protein
MKTSVLNLRKFVLQTAPKFPGSVPFSMKVEGIRFTISSRATAPRSASLLSR